MQLYDWHKSSFNLIFAKKSNKTNPKKERELHKKHIKNASEYSSGRAKLCDRVHIEHLNRWNIDKYQEYKLKVTPPPRKRNFR